MKKTAALGLPPGQLRSEQVIAYLKAIERTIQFGRDGAGPGLLEVLAIGPAPTGAQGTGLRQQALVTLPVMKGAQC
ncbi:hypothetical protein D3C84_1144210 [compost metagenome]